MGSSESTRRSNGGENEEERPTAVIAGGIAAAAAVIGTAAVVCLSFVGKPEKMMKAPGAPGETIARAVFEDNPKEYFANRRRK